MSQFDHEKLDVYRASIELVVVLDEIIRLLPRGQGHLTDQLQRAGTSMPLNIAEGAGEYSVNEKSRFYRMAKRSATECAAILHVCVRLGHLSEDLYARARGLLLRIVSMLVKMVQR